MSEVPTVIDGQLALGQELRDAGIARVSSLPERKAWLDRGLRLIEATPVGTFLSADAIRGYMAEPPHPNVFGALFRMAHTRGFIESAGFQQSERKERHASVQRVWRRVA
jgi:hypothetical protein